MFQYSGRLKVYLITSGKYVESLSHWPRGLRRGFAAARLQGLWVRMPLAAWNSVVGVVCCQAEVPAAGFSLVRSPTECNRESFDID
jgi:hypothetical protein